MKYIIMDIKDGDIFNTEFDDKDAALKEAEAQWERLTEREKRSRDEFYILESENPDEEAENHFDGDVIKKYR